MVYLYDADGRWLGENIENGTGVVTHETRFVYDGDQIVLQFDEDFSGTGTPGVTTTMSAADLSHRYLWGPATDELLSDEQLSPLSSGEGQGEGYNLSAPGTLVLPLTDNLGTVRDLAICDPATGTTSVANHLEYNSFGQMLRQTNPTTGNAAAVDCLFGFTGRPLDKASGLQNNLNRWYDSSTGRWIIPDPTGFAAGDTNEYRYVGNSPANGRDPTGLAQKTVATGVKGIKFFIEWLPEKATGEIKILTKRGTPLAIAKYVLNSKTGEGVVAIVKRHGGKILPGVARSTLQENCGSVRRANGSRCSACRRGMGPLDADKRWNIRPSKRAHASGWDCAERGGRNFGRCVGFL